MVKRTAIGDDRARSAAGAATAAYDLDGRRLHFVGIGGCGMSGLARLCAGRGAVCSGSDRAESDATASLRAAGIGVTPDQSGAGLPDDLDVLVVSAAIPEGHPERVEARRRGVEVVKYATLLGRLMLGRTGVAVAGTHGKSSTTSMLAWCLIHAGLDPSVIVGATCGQVGGGWRLGGSPGIASPGFGGELLVAEACEYDRSFHQLHPTHGIVLNVEADHLDLYRDLDEIITSFATFARRIPREEGGGGGGGSLLIQHESPARLAVTAGLACRVETYGFAPGADWRVGVKGTSVWLHHRGEGEPVCRWTAPLPGEHMAANAAAAAVTAHRLGASWDAIGKALTAFRGLDRRMQRLGEREGVTVIDDYGHHPTEIDVTLRALRRHHDPERLICVFQPHQHSRTRHLLDQFAASFAAADVVVVPEIYFVRDSEHERQAVTAGHLVDRLRDRGTRAMHLHPFEAIVEQLEVMTRPGDLVVTMGAGDVWKIGRAFLDTR